MGNGFGGDVVTIIFTIVIPILAGICVLLTIYFAWKAFASRRGAPQKSYDVGRVEAKIASQVYVIRSIFMLVLSLILLGVMGIGSQTSLNTPPPTNTPEPIVTAVVTQAATSTPNLLPTSEPRPTSPIPTATATPLPTATNTPEPLSATVNSEVGIWLRSAPTVESDQLEYLIDGTVVLVLPGREAADDLEWQEVQTDAGLVGWVAADFIVLNQ